MWVLCRRLLVCLVAAHAALSFTEVSTAYFARDVAYDAGDVMMVLACFRYEFLGFSLC